MKNCSAYWSLVLLFLYYTIDRWMPLGRWNGNYHWPVHNDQFWMDVFVCSALVVFIFCFRLNLRAGMIACVALLSLWVYFHLRVWWLPYFRGVSPRGIAFHEQFLAKTQIFPRYGNHIPPDAEHTFIDVFVFPAFVLCLIATVRSFVKSRKPPA